MKTLNRRDFLKMGLTAGSFLALGEVPGMANRVFGKTESPVRMIILGMDGMDPRLTDLLIKEGKLPAFQKLRAMGDFSPLRTSTPPQSPVAWSNFMTGMNPGGHGIFDFIHRNAENYTPISSSAETSEAARTLNIGNLVLPLSGGEVVPVRQGKTFWQYLEDKNIPSTVYKMPGNYPPAETGQRTISGMGTPDLTGAFRNFNYYTTESREMKPDIGGGEIHEVYVIGNRVDAVLPGPVNSFKKNRPKTSINFKAFIDPEYPVAKIAVQDHEFILNEGEWSGWKRIHFDMIPTQRAVGICRFYLKQVHPHFKLYVSPINIDPADPALPISTPDSYARELADKFGPFYTQGLPADTNALDHGVLDEREFLSQDDLVLEERARMFDYELDRFETGLLFYYLSSTDQRQHMFWRLIDKNHPYHDEKLAAELGGSIRNIYIEADKLLDKALSKVDKNTIIMVMSDHGFSPFRRTFNLNSWLKQAGYHTLIDEWAPSESLFLNTDWTRTKAYSYGINSLFINQRGREAEGIVSPGTEKRALVREIIEKLEAYRDPETGEKPVLKAYSAEEAYSGGAMADAPDIILGFNTGYRMSWSSPLGRITKNILGNNMEKWSGDHCMDPSVVPGILFTNKKIRAASPSLIDLTATILHTFGIEQPEEMRGKPVF